MTGSQLIFNGTTWPAIRGTFFQRDSAYFALRNTVDQVISTVKQQFYQVLLNRELIVVQEDSVRLLENQLKDQENRFEAGTVPRFNVLQAQVQLANQIPQLITARNNYRISILQLAKTLGLDFNPARGIAAPLRVVGKLTYIPRRFDLLQAIEFGKQNRPFLKQARANVLNQIEQVHVALGGFFPTINGTGGGEWLSSPVNSSFHDISKGWIAQGTASWPIWDSGQVYGQWKQQRALLSEAKISYDDDVRQVELEIQQTASNVLQNRELIQATEKTVEEAAESVRLAQARLDAGAGVQLDVLNAQVQLTTAQSNRLQALFGYIASVAEFDRAEAQCREPFEHAAQNELHQRPLRIERRLVDVQQHRHRIVAVVRHAGAAMDVDGNLELLENRPESVVLGVVERLQPLDVGRDVGHALGGLRKQRALVRTPECGKPNRPS